MARLLFVSFLLGMVACGGQDDGKATAPHNDSSVAVADDSGKQTAPVAPDPMGDDSVFTDGSVPTSWENAGFTDPAGFKQFLLRLRTWSASGQKDSVAQVIDYPLRNPVVKSKEQFLQRYDSLFNDKVKQAIQDQNLRQIFRRDQGAMIGDGTVWFRQSGNRFVIVGINNK